MRFQSFPRLLGLLLTVLLSTGCGAPPTPSAPRTAVPPPSATQQPVAPTSGYPAPATAPAGGTTLDTALSTPASAPGAAGCRSQGAPVSPYRVVATYPHDPTAYTEGLLYLGADTLYEGTGDWQNSLLREVTLSSGQIKREVKLREVAPPQPGAQANFGELVAHDLGRRPAIQALGPRIPKTDRALRGPHVDRIAGLIEQGRLFADVRLRQPVRGNLVLQLLILSLQ